MRHFAATVVLGVGLVSVNAVIGYKWDTPENLPAEAKLRRYLVDRYERLASCLELGSDDAIHYRIELRQDRADYSEKEFSFLTLAIGGHKIQAHFRIVPPGKYADDNGCEASIGTAADSSPAAFMKQGGRLVVYLLDPETSLGTMPSVIMSNRAASPVTMGAVFVHEVDGHLKCLFDGALTKPSNDSCAVDAENRFRTRIDQNAPIRFVHDPPRRAVGP